MYKPGVTADIARETIEQLNRAVATLPPCAGGAAATLYQYSDTNGGAAATLYPHNNDNGTQIANKKNLAYCHNENKYYGSQANPVCYG